jgi:hypothetical protein
VKRGVELVNDSSHQNWLVTIVTAVLILLVGCASFVSWLQFDVEGLATVLAMFFTYVALMGNRDATRATVAQAETQRLDATAAAVSIRMSGLVPVDTVEGTRIDVSIEIQNHGSLPALVTAVQPTVGSVSERTPVPVPQVVTLMWKIPPAAAPADIGDRTVTLGLTVQNLTRTVTDEYRLTFDLRTYGRSGSTRTWSVEKNPGYAELVRRSRKDFPTAPVAPLRRRQEGRVGPAIAPAAPSPRRQLDAGAHLS